MVLCKNTRVSGGGDSLFFPEKWRRSLWLLPEERQSFRTGGMGQTCLSAQVGEGCRRWRLSFACKKRFDREI